MSEPRFPAGWEAGPVKDLIDHDEGMSEEDEAASDLPPGQTVVTVPE